MTIVSVVQHESPSYAVRKAVDLLGGIEKFVNPQDKVVIKPNLTTALPSDTGLTTDPRVVQEIVRLCREVGSSDITIAEGSGGVETKVAFERCAYSRIAEKYGVKLVDLNESPVATVTIPEGRALRALGVPKLILECDVLINVPKFKLRKNWATLSIKNLLGVVPGKGEFPGEMWTPEAKWFKPRGEKKRVHSNLNEGLVDLNTVIHPTLNVMDGITASYEHKPVKLNTVLASEDPLALDSIATKIGGLNLLEVPYLRRAAERGLGETDYDRIDVVGTPLDRVIETWKAEVSRLQRVKV
ncbi:DUF362 domain-containing protein [Candidatus Bathyarchaeota archaeon]|nr:DUF362 domain-containing protein [Candidatus Bathyarchaeota archaeon]